MALPANAGESGPSRVRRVAGLAGGAAVWLAAWLTPSPSSWAAKVLYVIVISALLAANAVKTVVKPIWRLFCVPEPPPLIVRTPDARFTGLNQLGYEFEANYIAFPLGGGVSLPRLHYLDEGPKDGTTILCLHGEPSWSFLYRKMIPVLVNAGYRVVVPDFIGFGKSDKYTNANNYTHELHMATVRLLLDHLGLTDTGSVTLVCQDWGGLTGLSVVKDMKDTFNALVIMNTGLPTGGADKTMDDGLTADFLPFLVWRLSISLAGNRLPVKFLFRYVFGFSEEVADAYDAPFPDWRYRGGAAQWPLLVPLYKDDPVTPHMVEAIKCLKSWSKPALIMFSDKDPVTRGIEEKFMKWIPNATKIDIKGAGHMLQESHGKELANNIASFLGREL